MLVFYALGAFLMPMKLFVFYIRLKPKSITLYPELMKIYHFMRRLRIYDFKTHTPYITVKKKHAKGYPLEMYL